MTKPPAQEDMFLNASLGWFHVFNDMVNGGDLRKLMDKCPSSIGVYLVIKSLVHYKKGVSFPSVKTIMERTRLSNATIHKSLHALEEYGYITITKDGRKNIYRVREKIKVTDSTGAESALVSFDYFGSVIEKARQEIKDFLVKPNPDKNYQYIHIENLNITLNQQNVIGGEGVQVNQPTQINPTAVTEEEGLRIENDVKSGLPWNEVVQQHRKRSNKSNLQ